MEEAWVPLESDHQSLSQVIFKRLLSRHCNDCFSLRGNWAFRLSSALVSVSVLRKSS